MNISHWIGAAIAALAAPLLVVWLKKRAQEVPDLVERFLSDELHDYVFTKVDDPTKRLLKRVAGACFAWADEEMPDVVGAQRMDAVIARLKDLPALGGIVALRENDVRDLLEVEYQAWKANVASKAKELGQGN